MENQNVKTSGDTEFRGICVGIRMAPTRGFPPESFSAWRCLLDGSGLVAQLVTKITARVQLQQLKVEEISPFFFFDFLPSFGFCFQIFPYHGYGGYSGFGVFRPA